MERVTQTMAAAESEHSLPADAAGLEEASTPAVSPAQAAVLWERFNQELRAFVAKRVTGKADVDDLLQAIFLRIHTTLSRPIEIIHPRGWIFQVARSVLIDHLRATQTKNAHLNQVAEGKIDVPGIAPGLTPELGDDAEAEETLIGCLKPVLEALPDPYRQALVWTELENMSQREAATKAGISVSCMKSRVQRGRAQLKDALLACCNVQLDRRRHPIACERKSSDADVDDTSTEEPPAACGAPCA